MAIDMYRKALIIFALTFAASSVCGAYRVEDDGIHAARIAAFDTDTTDVVPVAELAYALDTTITDPADTAVKVRDRGFDASQYSMLRRWRPEDRISFRSDGFLDNTFLSLHGSAFSLFNKDYSFGGLGGISAGKWITEDHGARVNIGGGYWYDNGNAQKVKQFELTASYMFNFMSFIGGYNPARFCELSAVVGLGYAYGWHSENKGSSFTGHIGVNCDLKIFDRLHLFVEPQLAIYTNGMALSRAGNWRSYLSAFNGMVGLSYNFGHYGQAIADANGHSEGESEKFREQGYFLSFAGGFQFQTSKTAARIGNGKSLGMHWALGFGRWYNDFFGLRLSAGYNDHKWIRYPMDGKVYKNSCTVLRLEGMLDVYGLVRHCLANSYDAAKAKAYSGDTPFSASLLLGPEVGYMCKRDLEENVTRHYAGLTGGIQLKYKVVKNVGVFFEPRFSLVPYSAPSYDETSLNKLKNYYDGILNFNLGVEYSF